MAIGTGTYQTYTAIGNREDLIELITVISPRTTPVLSSIGTTRASAVLHEWQTDALTAPTANAHIEGDVTAASTVTPTTRLTNRTQILKKRFLISETQEAVNKAGRGSEIDYQTEMKLAELATDIEYAFVFNSAAASGASGTARKLKGINGFVTTNTSTASAARALTTAVLDPLLADVWAAGGNPDTLLVGGFQKQKIAGFSSNTRDIAAESRKIVNSVDIYQSSFGTLMVKLSHIMNSKVSDEVYVLEMKRWRKAWLRPIMRKELAQTGDARNFSIVAEVTLESLAENSGGKVKDLTTA